jgi:hypothetical protein
MTPRRSDGVSGPSDYEASKIAALALMAHEDAPWGCSCGAKFGDSIDRRWHLANQMVAATLRATGQAEALINFPPTIDAEAHP